MKYKVNDDCIGCGLCESICPNVFSVGDNGLAVAVDAEVAEVDSADAAEAKANCPVDAIEEA